MLDTRERLRLTHEQRRSIIVPGASRDSSRMDPSFATAAASVSSSPGMVSWFTTPS
jgi:hypothetical protein